MKNFSLYLNDVRRGKVTTDNPNVNTPGLHRKPLQYKVAKLRRGMYQPWRTRFRKNRLCGASEKNSEFPEAKVVHQNQYVFNGSTDDLSKLVAEISATKKK